MTKVTTRHVSMLLPAALDPRRSLAAALGWVVSAIVLGGAWAASWWMGSLTRERVEAQAGVLYQQYALQISNVLDYNLQDRLEWIRAAADLFATQAVDRDASQQRALLARLHGSLPELAWLGFATPDGALVAATGAGVTGQSVGSSRWFAAGRELAWIGEAGDASAPVSSAPTEVELAAPVRDGDNQLLGVIGARLSWDWVRGLEDELTAGLKSGRPVASLITDRTGRVLVGPAGIEGTTIGQPAALAVGAAGHLVRPWPDGGQFVSGYAVSDGAGSFKGLGWTVWVREPVESALADARSLERTIFLGMLLIGLTGALVSVITARRLTRELSDIAASADAIRAGTARSLVVPAGEDEAARIGHSLQSLLDDLHAEREALRALNAELDARVAARTGDLARMSEENRYAAVVRERLRMARDLHDTLAHSMMALLTEIRVLRKVAQTHPEALADELANAEAAAHAGLREARAAIQALRHNDVRDIGLGASVQQLFSRLAERRGMVATFMSDATTDRLADARAETLYRIVEEALHNVERHAGAARVTGRAITDTTPDGHPHQLALEVADDGIGFDPDQIAPGHYGVRGMHEQAALIGAAVTLHSTPGAGTTVRITLPL